MRMTLMIQAGAAVTPPPYAGWGRWGPNRSGGGSRNPEASFGHGRLEVPVRLPPRNARSAVGLAF